MPRLEDLKRGWTAAPAAMAGLLEWRDRVLLRIQRLNTYASLQSDMDLGDSRFQAMRGEAQDLLTTCNAGLAFLDADVLALGEARLEAYLGPSRAWPPTGWACCASSPQGTTWLPPGEERVAAMTAAMAAAPAKVSGILNDVDLPGPAVTLSTGAHVTLNTATYTSSGLGQPRGPRTAWRPPLWPSQKAFGTPWQRSWTPA